MQLTNKKNYWTGLDYYLNTWLVHYSNLHGILCTWFLNPNWGRWKNWLAGPGGLTYGCLGKPRGGLKLWLVLGGIRLLIPGPNLCHSGGVSNSAGLTWYCGIEGLPDGGIPGLLDGGAVAASVCMGVRWNRCSDVGWGKLNVSLLSFSGELGMCWGPVIGIGLGKCRSPTETKEG